MKIFKIAILLFVFSSVTAQDIKTKEFYSRIKQFDLSHLWRNDSIDTPQDPDGEKIVFPEPLGFIGDSFQRFYIHYTSVAKSKTNPYIYEVKGKSRVKNNVCNFKGTIKISNAKLYVERDVPEFEQGFVTCEVNLYEDSVGFHTGYFTGKLKTNFCIDKKHEIYYDAIMIVADGYYNNQCIAKWIDYKTKQPRTCNWGDFRIPNSRALDSGCGAIIINKKYEKFGWQTFVEAYSADNIKAKKAIVIEQEKWWND